MTVSPALAARLIAGAKAGRLLLTLDESRDMLNNVHPLTSVTVDGIPRLLTDIPITIIDDLDPYPNLHLVDERNRLEEWHDQLTASLTDDLIDADDVERLWHQPPPGW